MTKLFILSFTAVTLAAQHGVNPIPIGAMHVEGNLIKDKVGQTIVLRGAVIPFESIDRTPNPSLTPTTFSTMRQRFNMNALRLLLLPFFTDSANLTQMANIVRQANDAGLVVILVCQGGGTPQPGVSVTSFWQILATYFKDNPMVIFDVYDEPRPISGLHSAADWQFWLKGGIAPTGGFWVGMQGLVDAIRATGAWQIIAVQGFNDALEFHGFNTFISDSNIVYEVHPWFSKDLTDADRDAQFGFLSAQVPVLAGAWGFIPGEDSANCRALPNDPAGAEQIINATMDYFERYQISWTYSTFEPGNLYIDFGDYYRTDLTASWTCGAGTPAGMGIGETVQYYLDGLKEDDLVPVSGAAGNIVGSARGSIVHMYGYNMAASAVATAGDPVASLGGITLHVIDSLGVVRTAPLVYVSPFLVNFVLPEETATGPATFQIVGGPGDGLTGPGLVIDTFPGLFTGPANGRGAAIGFVNGLPVWQCDDSSCLSVPIAIPQDGSVTLTLIGAGFRNALHPVTATVGGIAVPVTFAGVQDLARGIDEVDLQLGSDVRGLGDTSVLIFADGIASNAVKIRVQ